MIVNSNGYALGASRWLYRLACRWQLGTFHAGRDLLATHASAPEKPCSSITPPYTVLLDNLTSIIMRAPWVQCNVVILWCSVRYTSKSSHRSQVKKYIVRYVVRANGNGSLLFSSLVGGMLVSHVV